MRHRLPDLKDQEDGTVPVGTTPRVEGVSKPQATRIAQDRSISNCHEVEVGVNPTPAAGAEAFRCEVSRYARYLNSVSIGGSGRGWRNGGPLRHGRVKPRSSPATTDGY